MKKIINQNNIRMQPFIGNDRLNENKFVTAVTEKKEETVSVQQKDNNNDYEIEYSFGEPFKYHQVYQHDAWYIPRKYESLKSEILLNKFEKLPMKPFIYETTHCFLYAHHNSKWWPEYGVYHGISTEMLFAHSAGSFYGPLST
eukprot:186069_1